jgi:hypothetical protein
MAHATCSIEGCDDDRVARGWCAKHYQRWKKHGDPNAPGKERRLCTVTDCGRTRFGQGYCRLHYDRWRAHGDPLTVKLNRQHDGSCSVTGCERPYKGDGLCHLHLRRLRATGTTGERKRPPQGVCSERDCKQLVKARGLCGTHYARSLRQQNPGKHASAVSARRTSARASEPLDVRREAASYRALILGDPCVYCGVPSDTADHIRPLKAGGTERWDNLAPCCRSCNSSKNDKHLLTHLLRRLARQGGVNGGTVRSG